MDIRNFMFLVNGAAGLITAFGAPAVASAFAFQPSVMEFTLADQQLSKTFTAANTGDTKVAVQVSAHARSTDIEGKETLPATDHFSIFPKQLILGPNESKTVRVTYTGPKPLAKETAYRIVAEQLPVDLKAVKAAGTNLKFLIKYQTSVYVVPARARAKIIVESAKTIADTSTGQQLELVFRNDGDAHKVLTGAKVILRDSKNPKTQIPLAAASAKTLETVNVLAGEKRRVLLPWPGGAPTEAFDTASIEFN